MKVIKKSQFGSGMDRVKYEETEMDIDNQILVEFFTMAEIFEIYPNHHFDKYGNLILRTVKTDKLIDHLAPTFFSDLGTIHHIHSECGFAIDKTFIKRYL